MACYGDSFVLEGQLYLNLLWGNVLYCLESRYIGEVDLIFYMSDMTKIPH
jgi:hypothetical protein